MTDTNFPEAGAIAFTSYKRTDGFIINLTLRDTTGADVLKRMDGAIIEIKKQGGVPYEKQSGFQKKEKEYIPDRKCPQCGMRLVKTQKRDGTQYVKCENNKWDAIKQVATGCPYVEWKPAIPERDINDV